MDHYIGIDLGTSSVKVVVTDDRGKVERSASRSYVVSEPADGWREIDPELWWHAVCEALHELLSATPATGIKGIGVTGQMHTVVPLAADGTCVRPAMLWNDSRTSPMVDAARSMLMEIGEDYLAHTVSTGSPALSLAWMRTHEPNQFSHIASCVIAPDWITYRLTGAVGIDWCGASTSMLFDLVKGEWSPAVCDALGIPTTILPKVQEAQLIVGGVCERAAHECGIPVGTPVVRGTGDNPAAAIPTGCLTGGVPVISLGTSGVLMYARPGRFLPSCGKAVQFRATGDALTTLVQLSLQSCGNAMDWLVRELFGSASYAIEDELVADPLYDTKRLIFYPFLNGDKTLYRDPELRGAFVGLSLNTSRSDLRRAVMEGICFGFRQLKEQVGGSSLWDEVRVVGGGAQSDLWMQIMAAILQCDVVRLKGVQGAAQGAAAIAIASVTHASLDGVLERGDEIADSFAPKEELVERYDRKYELYKRLHDAVGTLGEA